MSYTEWPEVTLGDHVDLLSGFAFKSKQFTDEPDDIPLVKGANVHQGFIDWETAKRWPASELNGCEKFFLAPDDVVLAMDRPWIEAGLKWAWIRPEHPKSLLVQRVSRMRGLNDLDTQFLRYIIGSPQFTDYIRPIVTGVNVPHISGGQIKGFKFQLPPLPTQRKIASILSAYDDLIENNTRRIAILEEMAQAIYREWFVNFRFPGHENVKLVDSPLGQIPEGWEVVTIGDIAKRNSESVSPSKHPDEYFEHFSLPAFDVNVLPVIEAGSSIKSNKTVVTQDSVLISKLNPRIPRVWLPFPSEETRSIGSTEFMIMRPEDGISREFLYSLFRSDEFHDRFAICSGGTSTSHQRVKPPNFLKLPVVLPTGEQMERFQPIVHPLLTLAQNKRIAIENLRTTRDLLLPKLISGKLDVEDLDIDVGMTAEALEEATA